jgi:aspartate/methionine/tyrosine aminotransferase
MAGYYQRRYGVTLNPLTEIQPLIGSKEGILHTTLAFVNPGEKVLVPNPGYPTYTALSQLLGCEVVYYDLLPENDWQPDFDAIEATDLSKVKIMWVNYPHMPTGSVALQETYERLVAFGRRHNILIVNDNPYSTILNRNPQSLLQVPGAMDCCIEFNSMSKSHNMPGWRIGMVAAKEEYIKYILRVKSNIDSGTFRAMQLAAVAAYDNEDAWHEEHNYNVYKSRRHAAEQIMDALHCKYDPNQVGMFLWGRIPDHYDTVETLTERLLHEAKVFIAPGFVFGSNGNRYIRISLCATEEKIQEALHRIRALQL